MRSINRLTWVIWNLLPLGATKPCSLSRAVISVNERCWGNKVRSNAIALRLFGLFSALALLVLQLFSIAWLCLLIRLEAMPSLTPLFLFTCKDCLVHWLIRLASYSAILLIHAREHFFYGTLVVVGAWHWGSTNPIKLKFILMNLMVAVFADTSFCHWLRCKVRLNWVNV